ncbi:hypothetical protein Phi40:1_gp060 [Cellulophaga phage phi40:1]|uniref:Uncharacterized protein n=1 Tax=Cellulophaga phage phi38:1 TaxID=1327977 RepID=R9ZZZ5_9CAUD|nr:hypothetical protein Phi38:1_gp060 [Cellulophaga phage phi38:1]AGO47925.1 hypothetical protein Phi40:1_gp060 [Cellulophaga phage phi40:1]AGO48090.1 hypothetical protein Phi38:1_gp060 [Cellulophaga phage phi38:1]
MAGYGVSLSGVVMWKVESDRVAVCGRYYMTGWQ